MPQLGAPGLRKAGLVFIDVWYHMKPREPFPDVGNPLLSLGRNQVFLAIFHAYCLLSKYSARNTRLFGRTSECNHSETVCPNHLKFAVQVVPTMDPCGLEFQVIRTNGSRVIAVGSWAEKIGNLQFY